MMIQDVAEEIPNEEGFVFLHHADTSSGGGGPVSRPVIQLISLSNT